MRRQKGASSASTLLLEKPLIFGIDVVPDCVWGTENVVPATGVYAMPLQDVGIEVAAPPDRAAYADGEAYAAACWTAVTELAARHGADAPYVRAPIR